MYTGVFIVGDFNFPNIRWIEGSGFSTSSFSGDDQAFANLFLDYNFFQFVDGPTRNANLLDLVFTNSLEILLSIDSGFHLQDVGLPSDHYPVIFDIAVSVRLRNVDQRLRFDFSKANFDILNNNLALLPLGSGINTIKSQEELDTHWDFWCDLVT